LRDALLPSVGDMKNYLVEQYLPGVSALQLEEASAQLAAAAMELAEQGIKVRYINSTFIPEEESCFCGFESVDAESVRRACEQAGVPFARIVETHNFFPNEEDQ
jgi:hypothetical protein